VESVFTIAGIRRRRSPWHRRQGIWILSAPHNCVVVIPAIYLPAGHGKTLPAAVDDYFNELEKKLAKLNEHKPHVKNLVLPGGGSILVPDLFRKWCKKNGITLDILEPGERLPNIE
jgi:hypothetical protein